MLNFRNNRPLQLMSAWLVIFWIWMAIEPKYRHDWMLENMLVIIYAIILVLTYPRFKFSNRSYFMFTIFMTLHLIGAHYTYAETPLGYWLQDWFGWQRNHFDRIVHFLFGLLIAYPIWELATRAAHIKASWSYFTVTLLILAMGSVFEIIEMWAALIVSPELGDAYLGTQGDIWDAQQDMFLATVGGAIAMVVTAIIRPAKVS
ncbi:MAG: DUF2238 domain-containing protein [Gammaproteobacteria bacterium]|nr:DUF2238 domain-containing protein [Gammaproteobacteria bacterium]